MTREKGGSLLGGTLLVAGTAIGGGMLALPVLTAMGGFFPAVLIYFLCWVFMASTGILLTEIYLWKQEEVNLVSMASYTLGNGGKIAAWIMYIFLFYSLTVAYVAGGGLVAGDFLQYFVSWSSPSFGPILFVAIFGLFVYRGAKAVDRMNSVLMAGLIISFIVFVVIGIPHIDFSQLTRKNFSSAFLATPVVFTSFGFQGIVPTLTTYLRRDGKRVRLAIIIGSAIPLICYIIWEALILGIIPLGDLEMAKGVGQSAVYPLKKILNFPWLFRVGEFFAFFAIVTSFLGVTLGLLDFLADGLKIQKTPLGRMLLCLMIYLPALAIALSNPTIFLKALQYAGGFGCALLLGLMPILMAWSGRYRHKFEGKRFLPGGKVVLTLLLLFIVFELCAMGIESLTSSH